MGRVSTFLKLARSRASFTSQHVLLWRAPAKEFTKQSNLHRRYATASSYLTDQWKRQIVADKLLTSPYQGIEIPETSFPEYIFSVMDKHRNLTMLINGITGEKFSFHDCLHNIEKVASGLIRFGLKPGDKVAFYSYNQPEYVIAFMAVAACGATAVDINPNYLEKELKRQIDATDCKFIFSHTDCVEKAKTVASASPAIKGVFIFGKADGCIPYSHILEDDGTLYKGPHPIGDPRNYVMQMLASSGTTGVPKSVCKSHYSMTAMALSLNHEALATTVTGDIGLLVLPLYHIFPLLMILIDTIVGAGNVLLPKFIPETFLGAIEKHHVKSMPLVPPLLLFLLQNQLVSKYDLSSLKYIIGGAAPFSPELLFDLKKKFNLDVLRLGYGLTEICPVALGDIESSDMIHVGCPSPNTEIKFIDVDTKLQLGPNQKGEIVARSPTKLTEYLNNPEATAKTLDKDGWVYTGDIGYYNEDGHIYIVDRLKDLIKYKGHQVAPAELESLLLKHPAVKDAAVIGIPDARAGEVPRAFVVLEENLKGKITEEDLCKFIAGETRVENHLHGGVKFLDVIPKSPAGKILKKELRSSI